MSSRGSDPHATASKSHKQIALRLWTVGASSPCITRASYHAHRAIPVTPPCPARNACVSILSLLALPSQLARVFLARML